MKVKTSVDDKQVKEAFNRLVKLAPEKTRGAVKRSSLAVLGEAKRNCKVDQGVLRASLTTKAYENWLSSEVGTNLEYSGFIEYGTGPAAGHGRYFPPPGVLLRWMHLHGIPEEAEYAIRRKLFLQGTKPQPFLFPAWERERPEFISKIRNALKDATGEASKGG